MPPSRHGAKAKHDAIDRHPPNPCPPSITKAKRHTIDDPPSSELAILAPSTNGPRATRATGVDNSAFLPVNLFKSAAFFLAEVVKNFDGVVDESFEVDPLRRGVERREIARDIVRDGEGMVDKKRESEGE